MPQEPFLFAASIRDNIAYGRDGGFHHSDDFILTECYSQFMVQPFSGILWSAKFSVVFMEIEIFGCYTTNFLF